jgi:hypothetical protein
MTLNAIYSIARAFTLAEIFSDSSRRSIYYGSFLISQNVAHFASGELLTFIFIQKDFLNFDLVINYRIR